MQGKSRNFPNAKVRLHKKLQIYQLYQSKIIRSFIIWLAPRASKMNQIARCDWLPERARWSHLARSGLPAVSRKQNFTKSHIINPLLTKFVRLRWLNIGLVLFFFAKKELGQYPAILTSHLVNNPYLFISLILSGRYPENPAI